MLDTLGYGVISCGTVFLVLLGDTLGVVTLDFIIVVGSSCVVFGLMFVS